MLHHHPVLRILRPPDVFGVSEVVAVGRFPKPAPLAGPLAGAATSRLAAVTLAVVITTSEEEKGISNRRFQGNFIPPLTT
jgi:hypothetical protein